jgi:lysophospholipid acyltransferase (LPLAT)-like uncharacterized protein
MQFSRHIWRQRWAKVTIGVAAVEYLRFVAVTSRVTIEPADAYERSEADIPVIMAFWHGQHFLGALVRNEKHPGKMLVSRHHDGEINAIAAARLGVGTIRGSGNHGGGFVNKAGVAAFQSMLKALNDGCSIGLSADVPKVARIAGLASSSLRRPRAVQSIRAPSCPAGASCSTTGTAPPSIFRSAMSPGSWPSQCSSP